VASINKGLTMRMAKMNCDNKKRVKGATQRKQDIPWQKKRKSKRRSNNQPTIGEDGEGKNTEPTQEIEEMIDKMLLKR